MEDQQRRSECAEAVLDLQQTDESPDLTQTAESSEPKQPADNNPQSEGISLNGTLHDQGDQRYCSLLLIIINCYKC